MLFAKAPKEIETGLWSLQSWNCTYPSRSSAYRRWFLFLCSETQLAFLICLRPKTKQGLEPYYISKLVGKSRPYVSNSIRILSLPIEVKKLIKTGFLTSGHARALLNCNDAVSLSNLIVKKGLSVRQTELLAKRDKIEIANNKAVPIKKDLDTKLLEDELTAHLKFKVNIHADKKKNKGKINIQYKDNEELQTICEILKKQF